MGPNLNPSHFFLWEYFHVAYTVYSNKSVTLTFQNGNSEQIFANYTKSLEESDAKL